jgi:hypothetical protein
MATLKTNSTSVWGKPQLLILQVWSIHKICGITVFSLENLNPDVKVKKAVPQHTYGGTGGGGRMYSSYSFSTSALDGGERSASRPGRALTPGKEPPLPIGQEAGWAPDSVWTQEVRGKISCLCRRSNLVHPVVLCIVTILTQLPRLQPNEIRDLSV